MATRSIGETALDGDLMNPALAERLMLQKSMLASLGRQLRERDTIPSIL